MRANHSTTMTWAMTWGCSSNGKACNAPAARVMCHAVDMARQTERQAIGCLL